MAVMQCQLHIHHFCVGDSCRKTITTNFVNYVGPKCEISLLDVTHWVLAKRDIDSFQREKRARVSLQLRDRGRLGTGTPCKRGQRGKETRWKRAAWLLTYDKFGVLFNIGSACQKTGALMKRGFRIWLPNGRRHILKIMSKRNVSRKDADSEKDFRISIFFEAGEYFLPGS
jgi:hypothetical protein